MALDAGTIAARLAADFDERDFKAFDAEMARARAKSRDPIVQKVSADVDRRGFASARREIGQLDSAVARANRNTTFFGRAIGAIRWPALITGAGAAAQGLSALAGGATALTGALAPLSGSLVVLPALFGAIGQASGTVALAGVGDLTAALGGNEEALKKLTPQGRRFLGTLRELEPRYEGLRRATARPLFGGARDGLSAALKNFPALRRVLAGTAEVMGRLARQTGRLFGSEGFGRDFERIGKSNNRLLARLGRSGLNFGNALRHVMVSARPLVAWMGKLAVEWSRAAKGAARAGRETGRLERFFEKTQRTMRQAGSIAGSLAEAFRDIGRAAAPLGRKMLRAFDEAAESFARFTGSARGRNALEDYFKRIQRPLFEFGRLIRDSGNAFFRLGASPGLTKLLRSLRTDLLPVLEDVIASTTAAFGPVLAETLASVTTLLGDLAGTSGPLNVFTRTIGLLADGLHELFEASPLVKSATVTMLGFGAVLKALSLGAAIAKFTGLKKAWNLLRDPKGALAGLRKVRAGLSSLAAKASEGAALASAYVGDLARGLRGGAGRVKNTLKSVMRRAATAAGAVASSIIAGAITAGQSVAGAAGGLFGRMKDGMGRVKKRFRGFGNLAGRAFALGAILFAVDLFTDKKQLEKFGQAGAQIGAAILNELIQTLNDGIRLLNKALPAALEIGEVGEVDVDAKIKAQRENRRIEKVSGSPAGSFEGRNANESGGRNPIGGQRGGLVTPRGILGPFDVLGFQHGGIVPRYRRANYSRAGYSPPGPLDTVPAMLRPGELVVPKERVDQMRRRRGQGAAIDEGAVTETEKRGKKIADTVRKRYREAERGAGKHTKQLGLDQRKRWREVEKDTGERTKKIAKTTRERFSEMRDTVRDRGRDAAGFMRASMASLDKAAYRGFDYIAATASKSLKAFGAEPLKYSVDPPKGGGTGMAFGGRIPGYSRSDNFTIAVRGGERVLRPEDQFPLIDRLVRMASGGAGVDDILRQTGGLGYRRGGYVERPEAKRAMRGYAEGGWVDPAGPGTGVVNPAIAGAVGRWSRRYDAAINYGYDPGGGHVSPGHNVTGTATDTGPAGGWLPGPTQLFERGLKVLVAAGLKVLYGTAGIGTAFPNHGRGNHAHIEWGLSPPASLGGIDRIGRLKARGPLPLRDLLQGALDRARSAGNKMIGRASSRFGAGGVGAGRYRGPLDRAFPRGSAETISFNQAAMLAEAAGLPGITYAQIAQGESGLRPGAVSPDGGYGLWQMTPRVQSAATVAAWNRIGSYFNPWANARMAKYLAGSGTGISNYYGTSFVTNPNAHYNGPIRFARGGRVRGAGGGAVGPASGGRGGGSVSLAGLPLIERLGIRGKRLETRIARLLRMQEGGDMVRTGLLGQLRRRLGGIQENIQTARNVDALMAGRLAERRAASRVGAAQARVFAGFAQGGRVASGPAPPTIVLKPLIEVGLHGPGMDAMIGEIDARVGGQLATVSRKAGLARQFPSATGRAAAYGRSR